MMYEKWCECSTAIIAESEKYNEWVDKAKEHLLSNIGPRIAKLGKSGYMGCGFHYSMEETFGKLIGGLAIPWKPCANWCTNVEDDRLKGISRQSAYRFLLDSVAKAERSVPTFKKTISKCNKKLRKDLTSVKKSV